MAYRFDASTFGGSHPPYDVGWVSRTEANRPSVGDVHPTSDALEPTGGVAEARHARDAHPVDQAEVDVVHRLGLDLQVAPGREVAAAAAGEDERQVVVIVAVA